MLKRRGERSRGTKFATRIYESLMPHLIEDWWGEDCLVGWWVCTFWPRTSTRGRVSLLEIGLNGPFSMLSSVHGRPHSRYWFEVARRSLFWHSVRLGLVIKRLGGVDEYSRWLEE